MWLALAVILILWLLGWNIFGSGMVHALLVVALVLLVVQLVQGRRVD